MYRRSPTHSKITNTGFTTTIFWLMCVQVGDFCASRGLPTVPLTRISCNTVFSKSENAHKEGTSCTNKSACE